MCSTHSYSAYCASDILRSIQTTIRSVLRINLNPSRMEERTLKPYLSIVFPRLDFVQTKALRNIHVNLCVLSPNTTTVDSVYNLLRLIPENAYEVITESFHIVTSSFIIMAFSYFRGSMKYFFSNSISCK